MKKYIITNYNTYLKEQFNMEAAMKQMQQETPKEEKPATGGSSTSLPSTGFSQEEGDEFRQWANSTDELKRKYGKSSKYDLDATGKPDNNFIRKAYKAAKGEYEKRKEDSTVKSANRELEKTQDSSGVTDIIFSAGLDNRPGDKNLETQVGYLEKTTGKKVEGYRYNNKTGFINAIKSNPNAIVVMFSAGNQWAASAVAASNNKSGVYMIEPYNSGASGGTHKAVNAAIKGGVPSKNVIVGPNSGRGKGILDSGNSEPSYTPSGIGHWGSLQTFKIK